VTEGSEALGSIELAAKDKIEEVPGGAGVTKLSGTSGVVEAEAGGPTGVSVPAVGITPGAEVPEPGPGPDMRWRCNTMSRASSCPSCSDL
jgi:hypothetical protein